jgi:hypothetical protein
LDKNLHIITLNIPYPPDYGGIIDSFYRIRSLHKIGIKIHLHCFEYGRAHSDVLESFCNTINYYPRETSFIKNISFLPYTVISRRSDQLVKNLLKDDFPVLFDGLHTTYSLNHPGLSDRKKIVRVHNIEHNYYSTLAEYENNPVKKLYYSMESGKLKRYEKILDRTDYLLTVSETDQDYFESRYHNAELVPSFHPFDKMECITGTGEYIIYHGDLSVNDNVTASEFLISEVFSHIPYKCIIAGKNPPEHLLKISSGHKNIRIIANPDDECMTRLVKDAHINLLFTNTINGLKLKLLIALFSGRHCIVNSNMTAGTSLDAVCNIADSPLSIIENIRILMQKPFTDEVIAVRESSLSAYRNQFNATRMERLIFPEKVPD